MGEVGTKEKKQMIKAWMQEILFLPLTLRSTLELLLLLSKGLYFAEKMLSFEIEAYHYIYTYPPRLPKYLGYVPTTSITKLSTYLIYPLTYVHFTNLSSYLCLLIT